MRRGKGRTAGIGGLFVALTLAGGDAWGGLPPWGNWIPPEAPHVVVIHGSKVLRCWTYENVDWWCWNQDSVFEGNLKVDPLDPRGVNFLHFGPSGGQVCRYDAQWGRIDGKQGWEGTSRCVGAAGSGRVLVEINPTPVAVSLPRVSPPPSPPDGKAGPPNPSVWRSGALTVRIEGFRERRGSPGAELRCEWTTVYTNTGDELVLVDAATATQSIPARPGAEFNRDIRLPIDIQVPPQRSVTRPGDMGFTSSAAGIVELVRQGGIRWQNVRYQARSKHRDHGTLREATVSTTFSRIGCPEGPR